MGVGKRPLSYLQVLPEYILHIVQARDGDVLRFLDTFLELSSHTPPCGLRLASNEVSPVTVNTSTWCCRLTHFGQNKASFKLMLV